MAATVEIDETNGVVTGTLTHGITNSNYGSVDSVNLDPTANPLTPSSNSYEKWQSWHITAMGGSASVLNLKFFSTAPAANTTHFYNGHTTQGTYDATKKTTYAQPVTTTTITANAVVTSAPGSANIGIAGSLTGSLTGTGSSDYLVTQVRAAGGAVAGTTLTNTYRYDEIAFFPLLTLVYYALAKVAALFPGLLA